MNEKSYSVYKHTTPNGKIYIGITCRKPEKRWANGKGYLQNKYFTNAIKKYGWNNIVHQILTNNLTKEEAEEIEINLITNVYKSNNRKYGYNIENGGCHNGKTSAETRKKQSLIHKGKRHSPNTEFKKGHITIITEEMKQKISKKNKGKHACIRTEFKKGHKTFNDKKVLCIETNVIYNSIKEIEDKTKIMACHICEVCKGKRKSAGGYHWKYYLE